MLFAKCFESRGEIHGVPMHRMAWRPPPPVPGNYWARINANAYRIRSPAYLRAAIASQDFLRGLEGVAGMIGILDRHVERRQHRVALELRDDAVMRSDDPRPPPRSRR